MKYCIKCGAELGNEQFCTNCGNKTDASAVMQNSNKKSKKNVFIIIAAVVVVIAVVAFAFCGRSYKKVVDEYIKGVKNLDASKIVNLLPDEMIDYAMDEEGYSSKKEFEDYMQEMVESSLDSMANRLKSATGEDLDYSDINISYEITEVEDIRGSDWRRIRDDCEELEITPEAAKRVVVELTTEYKGEENTGEIWLKVIKIGKSWYLFEMI